MAQSINHFMDRSFRPKKTKTKKKDNNNDIRFQNDIKQFSV